MQFLGASRLGQFCFHLHSISFEKPWLMSLNLQRSYLFELSLIYNWGVQLPTGGSLQNVKAAQLQIHPGSFRALTIVGRTTNVSFVKITAWCSDISTFFEFKDPKVLPKVRVVIGIAYILLVGRWGLVEPEKTSRACLVHLTRITTTRRVAHM